MQHVHLLQSIANSRDYFGRLRTFGAFWRHGGEATVETIIKRCDRCHLLINDRTTRFKFAEVRHYERYQTFTRIVIPSVDPEYPEDDKEPSLCENCFNEIAAKAKTLYPD